MNRENLQHSLGIISKDASLASDARTFSRAHKHYDIRHIKICCCQAFLWFTPGAVLLGVYILFCFASERTGKDKGSAVGIFTDNTAAENSCRRRNSRGLMAGAKQPDHSCCKNLFQSHEMCRHVGLCSIPLLDNSNKKWKTKCTFWTDAHICTSFNVSFLYLTFKRKIYVSNGHLPKIMKQLTASSPPCSNLPTHANAWQICK